RRVWEHREGVADSFTKRYGCKTLVWYEHAPDIASAIQREKQMKEWQRHWKLRVIERMNPDWNDLFETVRSNWTPAFAGVTLESAVRAITASSDPAHRAARR